MGEIITAISDASFWQDGRAGFACYLIGAGIPRTYYSGRFRVPVADNNHAELLAVVNAASYAVRDAQEPYDAVLLQSDSVYALQVVLTYFGGHPARGSKGSGAKLQRFSRERRATRREKRAIEALQRVLTPAQLMLRHVPGHGKDGDTARGYINKQCDRLAREAARGTR